MLKTHPICFALSKIFKRKEEKNKNKRKFYFFSSYWPYESYDSQGTQVDNKILQLTKMQNVTSMYCKYIATKIQRLRDVIRKWQNVRNFKDIVSFEQNLEISNQASFVHLRAGWGG